MAEKALESLSLPGLSDTYVNTPLSTAPTFVTTQNYAVDDCVFYNKKLYKFVTAHSAGAWDSSHVTEITVSGEMAQLKGSLNHLERDKQARPSHTETGSTVVIDVEANTPVSQFDVDIPFSQNGSGNPSMTNYRKIVAHDSLTVVVNNSSKSVVLSDTVCVGTANLIDGKFVSRYNYIEFDGTENWNADTGNTHYSLRGQPVASSLGGNNKQHCTHFLCGYASILNLMATTSGAIDLQFPAINDAFPSLSDWKTYLSQQHANGTPVAICYELQTPVELTCTALDITTVDGENTFSCSAGNSSVTYLGDLISETNELKQNKLDKTQDADYAGRALVIGQNGEIVPSGTPFGAEPGTQVEYTGTIFDIESHGEQTVSATLESSNDSVGIWQYEENLLPSISSASIGNVNVTVESDGTLVFNGTTSAAGAVGATMHNMPIASHGNPPFDGFMFSWSMNKAAPNETGNILCRVYNQSNQNFVISGIKSNTALNGSIVNSYGDSTTSLKSFEIYFYNIPSGVVFDDWKIKFKLEHYPVATDYTKPSLSYKAVTITDGSGSAQLNLVNGINHILTNADKMKVLAKTTLKTPSYVGKRWACFGDSITQKDETAYRNGAMRYYDIVSLELGLTCINYGRATTGYSTTGSVSNGQYYLRMQNINLDDFDFMTIMGSTNDVGGMAGGSIQLGNYDDTGTTTVCGCINTTLDYYYSLAPLKPIGMISMLPTYAYGPNLVATTVAENYVNAQKQICANRGIPFLDLYHGSGMRPWVQAVKEALYSDGDGIHPNNEGIKWFAPMIREFVKSLM